VSPEIQAPKCLVSPEFLRYAPKSVSENSKTSRPPQIRPR